MYDVETYPSAQESIQRLIRSGWTMCQLTYEGNSGYVVWEVSGSNGENQISILGASPEEAWHRAVEAAAACGMLKGWPRPSHGM
jgi:hypothetical protein